MLFDIPKGGIIPPLTYLSRLGSGKEVPARFVMINAYNDRAEFMVVLQNGHLLKMHWSTAICCRADKNPSGRY